MTWTGWGEMVTLYDRGSGGLVAIGGGDDEVTVGGGGDEVTVGGSGDEVTVGGGDEVTVDSGGGGWDIGAATGAVPAPLTGCGNVMDPE